MTRMMASLAAGLCLVLNAGIAEGATGKASIPDLAPGQSVKLEYPVGWRGYFNVHVPKDYTPKRRWPVVLWYHGHGAEPSAQRVKRMAEGKGAVIIAMDYHSEKYHNNFNQPRLYQQEKQHVINVLKIVKRHLRIDTKQIFMGGFSQGGYMTTTLGEEMARHVKGLLIIGAHRSRGTTGRPPRAMRGMPVLVAHGSNDKNGDNDGTTTAFYRRGNVDVTHRVWDGLGHTAKIDCKVFDQWWRQNVVAPSWKRSLARAKQLAEAAPAEAYRRLTTFAARTEIDAVAKRAREQAKQLAEQPKSWLNQAKQLRARNRSHQAVRQLMRVRRKYPDTPFAETAKNRLTAMAEATEPDSALARQIRNARGRFLRERAERALKNDPLRAVKRFERYLEQFPNAPAHAAIDRRLKSLKQSDRLNRARRNAEAAETCQPLLRWAETYVRLRTPEKARPLLKKVKNEYPDTKWAEQAQRVLERF